MSLLTDIQKFLTSKWGTDYRVTKNKIDYRWDRLSFSKTIWGQEQLLMVVQPPIAFDKRHNNYFTSTKEPIKFFFYDRETEMIFGNISNIYVTDNWKKELLYKIITSEDKIEKCKCPDCGFWLVERTNEYLHRFIGCSGFPDCEYSSEIGELFDDEENLK